MIKPLELQIKMIEDNLKIPSWDLNLDNGGLDIRSAEDVVIKSNEYKIIRLGLATAFGGNYVALFRDRSSMAGKGLSVMGGVIDSSYRGEWKVILFNASSKDYLIKVSDKVVQVIFVPCFHLKINPVSSLPDSLRGEKGFGSSGV